jgi:hypothetical protein
VKCRADGFKQLYDYLKNRDLLIVKADKREMLVVIPLHLAGRDCSKGGTAMSAPKTNTPTAKHIPTPQENADFTAYVARDQDRERQYVDFRIRVRERNVTSLAALM